MTSAPKPNPKDLYGRPWGRREYIVVLHHYFLHRHESHDKGSAYVKEIADSLGRTPAAVSMRLYNFASLDEEINRARLGLQNIGPLGRDVFFFWLQKLEALHEVGQEYQRDAEASSVRDLFNQEPAEMPLAFGRYETLDAIGSGGFGTVLSCIDSESGASHAMKIIRSEVIEDPESLARFRREIKILRSIRHPNVITIYEDNLEQEYHYPAYVMDLGEWSLRLFLDRNRDTFQQTGKRPIPTTDEASDIVFQILNGVEALHSNTPPIAHRDIKPENILKLANGRWVVADFGLAKFLPQVSLSNSFATASKKALGSSGYAAPEQFMDFSSADERADIFALGVMIWELFSPAWGTIDRADTELPESLNRVVLKATERRPEKRHTTVSELRSDFEDALKSMPPLHATLSH